MLGILFLLVFPFSIPVEDPYANQNGSGKSVHDPHHRVKASAVQKTSHSASKHLSASKIIIVLFCTAAVMTLPVPGYRLTYRPVILLRLRLLMLFPIKFTSTFVSVVTCRLI
ncbi:hypothetical protein XI25_27360 [Paenibacillus sp. DMB20]|nr:hypothetical protein XI25_27360 [Paenibacillus sp. DMB20]